MAKAGRVARIEGYAVHNCAPAVLAPIRPFDSLEERLVEIARLRAPCPILIDNGHVTQQQGVDGDFRLGSGLKDGDMLLRLWRNRRVLVASCRQARLPAFDAARATSEAAGWPVVIRRSGGTAVVHRPGVLNVSLLAAQPPGATVSVNGDYAALMAVLRDMMAGLGIVCDQGEVEGAHCDGRYNLRWRGRKLAGTAGSVVREGARSVRMFHASLLMDGSIPEDLRAIGRFEAALGEPRPYDVGAHVSVRQILGIAGPVNDF